VIISIVTQSLYIASILTAVDDQKIGERTSEALCRKETQGPSIKGPLNTTGGAEFQTMAGGEAESHTH
jgi:hypothetical protein